MLGGSKATTQILSNALGGSAVSFDAQAGLAAGTGDRAFYETKLATGRYYMARQLPATKMHLARIESGAAPVMALDADAF